MIPLMLALMLQDPPTPVRPPTPAPVVQERPDTVNRIVRIRYADPAEIAEALRIFCTRWLQMDVNPNLRILTIVGPEKEVVELEKMIASLDVQTPPPAQIEFRVRILGASETPGDDKRDKLDEELQGVVGKLSKHFKLPAVWEIDSVLGRCEAGQRLDLSAGTYRVSLTTARDVDDRIQLRQFQLSGDASISTTLSVKPGETTVVGLTRTKSGQSMIAVITATVEK